jgi:uncharacterized protein YbjT (DUF2867 family)
MRASPTAKILVAGATGNVGPTLVAELVRTGQRVRVFARDLQKATRLLGTGVEVVRGDLSDPASLAPAFHGVRSAFVATAPTPMLGYEESNFIDAARAHGVERIVKLSGFGIEFATDRIHIAHALSEQRLRESGIPSVVLRPVVFMSNLLFDAASIQSGKLPSNFGDGRISLVDPRDVAEVAARALLTPTYEGQTLSFGGPEALSYDLVAATFTRLLGRPIEHVRMNDASFGAAALKAGLPEFVVEAITVTATSARKGRYEVNDDVVRATLGRRASNLAAWIVRHRDAFAPALAG